MGEPTVVSELRRATGAQHDALDAMPYARRVLDGTIRLEDYAAFLASLAVVHEAVQALAVTSPDAAVQAIFRLDGDALPALARDLSHLASLGVTPVVPSAAFDLAAALRSLHEREPRALAGVLYVLEGSKLGGVVQAAALSKIRGLSDRGRDYLAGTGARTRPYFRDFLARLEVALGGDASAAIQGAALAFEGFLAIVFSVSRIEPCGA